MFEGARAKNKTSATNGNNIDISFQNELSIFLTSYQYKHFNGRNPAQTKNPVVDVNANNASINALHHLKN